MSEHVPLPEPDPEHGWEDEQAFEQEPASEPESPSSLPLAVRRSLREVLGDDGEDVERVWLAALDSDSERIRLEAAKVLTQASVQLSRNGQEADFGRLPVTPAEVELLSREECYAVLVGVYLEELKRLRRVHGDEDVIRMFRQRHPELELPLALLQRALQ